MALSEVYEKRGPLNIKMRPGKKVISFSLWGNEPRYCMGAIKNAKIAQKIFKDWTCRFYVSNSWIFWKKWTSCIFRSSWSDGHNI